MIWKSSLYLGGNSYNVVKGTIKELQGDSIILFFLSELRTLSQHFYNLFLGTKYIFGIYDQSTDIVTHYVKSI